MKRYASGPRRKGRELALQILYQAEFRLDLSPEERETLLSEEPVPPGAIEFARKLVAGVEARKTELDALITRHSSAWIIQRIGCVERNIIRLGCYELLEGSDVPPAVAIDEAVELAKTFGSADSSAFVNGVLDAVRKQAPAGNGKV